MLKLERRERDLLAVYNYEESADIYPEDRLTTVIDGRITMTSWTTDLDVARAARRYSDYYLFCEQVDDLIETADVTERASWASQHAMLSSHTSGIWLDLGLRDLPVTITDGHLWDCMQPGEWEGGRHGWHGIRPLTMKRLPWLLERPALIANHGYLPHRLIAVPAATDGRGNPILVSIVASGKGEYRLDSFLTNVVATAFGPDNFSKYFGSALPKEKVIYIDSKWEERLSELIGQAPFPDLAELKRDVQLSRPDESVLEERSYEGMPDSREHNGEWLRSQIVRSLEDDDSLGAI